MKGGGCSGLSYFVDWADGPARLDQVFERDGARVFVDPKSYIYLVGTVVEYDPRTQKWMVNATIDGVVREPSAFAMTVGSPPSSTLTTEFVLEASRKGSPVYESLEVLIKGPGVMEGYHNQPEATADVLTLNVTRGAMAAFGVRMLRNTASRPIAPAPERFWPI